MDKNKPAIADTNDAAKYLSTAEAIAYCSLNISKQTFRNWADERRIRHHKILNRYYFSRADLDDFMRSGLIELTLPKDGAAK
jgi:excisionase family DNA binding protein